MCRANLPSTRSFDKFENRDITLNKLQQHRDIHTAAPSFLVRVFTNAGKKELIIVQPNRSIHSLIYDTTGIPPQHQRLTHASKFIDGNLCWDGTLVPRDTTIDLHVFISGGVTEVCNLCCVIFFCLLSLKTHFNYIYLPFFQIDLLLSVHFYERVPLWIVVIRSRVIIVENKME